MTLPTLPLRDGWCLRAWRESDAPSLAQHADDVEVWRHMSAQFPHPYTLDRAQHWITQGQIEFGGEHWAIALDDVAVGGCGLHPGNGRFAGEVEVGYWLGQAYWGRGVATEVVRVLTERALAMPGVARVFAGVHADNPASMRVLEKNGFTREGMLRMSPQGRPKGESFEHQREGSAANALKAGRPIDSVIYARIAA